MKRRAFIVTALAATAIITVPAINYRCRSIAASDPLFRPDILARFCDEKSIREIGIRYRSRVPKEDKKERLIDMILKDDSGKQVISSANPEVSDWIEKKIQQDFITNRIVVIDGWILSETEARQCALLSLD